MKSGSGFDFILNIGLPLGVSKLAQFRTRPVIAKPPGLPKGDKSSQTSKSAPPWPCSQSKVASLYTRAGPRPYDGPIMGAQGANE